MYMRVYIRVLHGTGWNWRREENGPELSSLVAIKINLMKAGDYDSITRISNVHEIKRFHRIISFHYRSIVHKAKSFGVSVTVYFRRYDRRVSLVSRANRDHL